MSIEVCVDLPSSYQVTISLLDISVYDTQLVVRSHIPKSHKASYVVRVKCLFYF